MALTGLAFTLSLSLAKPLDSYPPTPILRTSTFLKLVTEINSPIWPISYAWLIPEADHQGPIYQNIMVQQSKIPYFAILINVPNPNFPTHPGSF